MKSVTCGEVFDAIDELFQETDFVNKAYAKLARLRGVTNQGLIDMAKEEYKIPRCTRHSIADGFDIALINADYKTRHGNIF